MRIAGFMGNPITLAMRALPDTAASFRENQHDQND